MQSVPANWGSIFSASHKTEYRFTINGVNYEGDDLKDTPVVSKPLLDKPAIGRCCTGSAKVKIYPKGTIPKAATVDVYCRLRKNADNTVTNWLPQGKYYVSSRSGKNLLEITCLDRMIKAGVTYRDKSAFVSWPQPMSAVVNEICSIMGVTLDARTQIKTGAGYTVDYPNDDVLISEILGMIGAAHGGNWIFTETGKLRLVVLASPAGDAVQILGRTHTGFVARGKTQTISRVILVDDAENEFTAGDDSGLTISAKCNYATQAIASTLCSAGGIPLENGCLTIPDAAFSKGLLSVGAATVANGKIDLQTASVLYGVTYEPYTLSGAYLNPAIELGDTLSVTDRDGTVHRVVVFSLDMSCTVSCTCSLSALIDDETEDEYPYITARDLTLKRTVRTDQTYYGNRINRSEGFVSELLVNDVLTARLTANASAFSMQSKEGNSWIDRIYFDNITGKYVITGDVTVQGLATFISGLATSGSTVINGGNITTGQIKSNSGNGFTIDLTNGTISVGNKDLNTALNAIDNEIVISASAQMFTKASGASSYSPASITLTAQSTNTLASYQWYKNNTALSGKTARTLTITPSDISGTSATYKVVGTDAGGQTYTDMMTIAKLADGTSGEKGDKGDQGEKGDKGDPGNPGVGISSVTEYYAINNSSTTAPADNAFSTTVVSPTASKRFLWNYELITYTNQSTERTEKHVAAVYGQKGDTGSPGSQGDPGKGISSIVEYYAISNSTTAPDDNAFSTTVQTPTTSNKYLWNYELITYSDNTTSRTDKRIIGTYGDKGDTGASGVGISSITEYYAINNSTTAPADSAFSTTVVSPTASKRYLWNYELVTYTNGTTAKLDKHIAAVYGQKGDTGSPGSPGSQGDPGVGIASIVEYYAVNNSTTAPAENTFSTVVLSPTASNKYLWNYELITYTDDTTFKTDKRIIGTYGEKGSKGDKGDQGSPGADSYTAILSNEYVEIPVDVNRKPLTAKTYTCVVSVYKGITAMTATTGTPASGQFKVTPGTAPVGVTVAQNTAGTITLTVATNTAILDSSELPLTITVYGGVTVNAKIAIHANMNDVTVQQQSSIEQNATNITLKVSKNSVISEINQSAEQITISAAKINLSGLITAINADGQSSTIDGNKITTGTITATQIASGTITATQIKASTITGAKIASQTIEAGNIKSGTITATQIASGTITATQIASGTITATQIASGTITATQLAASTITGAKIASNTIEAGNIKASTITGAKIASQTIEASNIKTGTITATQIASGTITATQIASGTITATQIAASTITGAKIASNTIEASNIKASTITGAKIASGTIEAGNIKAGAITAEKIASGAITANMITTGTMSADRISGGTIDANNVRITNLDVSNAHIQTLYAYSSSYYVALKTSGTSILYIGSDGAWAGMEYVYLYATSSFQIGKYGASDWSYRLSFNTVDRVISPNGTSVYAWALGTSTRPFKAGYFTELYVNGVAVTGGTPTISVLTGSGSYNTLTLNSSRQLVPGYDGSSSTYGITLGNSSYKFRDLYTYNAHICANTNGTLSFFNATGAVRQTLSLTSNNMGYTSVTASNYLYALNNLIGILKSKYGLIA